MLFIFGLCISFLFRSYPYNMTAKRLCQQNHSFYSGKKYHVWKRLYIAPHDAIWALRYRACDL